MGQLVKIQDYISRYELDIFSYPSRFIKLKRRQWEKLKLLWESGQWLEEKEVTPNLVMETNEKKRWKLLPQWFKRKEEDLAEELNIAVQMKSTAEQFSLNSIGNEYFPKPDTVEELKMYFLNRLFQLQLRWASSTLSKKSFVHPSFYKDEQLKYFSQRFPDTFLFFYKPIFLLKKAPVETETILITPTDVFCLSFLEEEDESVFLGSSERFWLKKNIEKETKILSPMIALNRTETIVRRLLREHEVDLPITKLVICRNGYIDYPTIPFGCLVIDRKNYHHWFQSMRSQSSPLKHMQLKAAKALMTYCHSVYISRTNE